MKIVYKFSLLFLLALVCASPVPGQSVEPIGDPCGDPRVESYSCFLFRGKVVKVLDGDTFIMSLARGRRMRVHLIGIAAPKLHQKYGRAARLLLSSLVSGRKVEVCVNTSQFLRLHDAKLKEITGEVQVREIDMLEVNLLMIQAGLARYAEAKPYSMSGHAGCHYVRAEKEARAAGRGLWYPQYYNSMSPKPD